MSKTKEQGDAMQSYPRLESLSAFTDERRGIREQFLTPVLGGGQTIAVLSTPLGEVRPLGFVVCHSFALEQIYLYSLEVPVARALSAKGFPVLRFHSQGYGDSSFGAEQASLGSHLVCAADAVELLREAVQVPRMGLLGARFGGSVAALTAKRIEADAVAVWDPAIKGRSLINQLVRQALASELAVKGGRAGEVPKDPLEGLRATGSIDLQGFPFSRQAYDELMAMNLMNEMKGFSGASLVIQVSKSDRPKRELVGFVDRLAELGSSTHEIVVDERAGSFGGPRFRDMGYGTKQDSQAGMQQALVAKTLDWATSLSRVMEKTGA